MLKIGVYNTMIGPKICSMICDLKFRNKAIIPSSGYTCGLDQYCQLTLFKLFTKSCFSIDSFKTKIYISITIVCKTVGIKTLSKINQVKSMDGWEEKRNFSSYLKLKKFSFIQKSYLRRKFVLFSCSKEVNSPI